MKTAMLTVLGMTLFAFATLAADVSGTWTGVMKSGEGGAFEVTLTLKADASGNLTGTMTTGSSDPRNIESGKISGNQVSFAISYEGNGQKRTINYNGTMDGNQLKLAQQIEGRKPREFTLTRQ